MYQESIERLENSRRLGGLVAGESLDAVKQAPGKPQIVGGFWPSIKTYRFAFWAVSSSALLVDCWPESASSVGVSLHNGKRVE